MDILKVLPLAVVMIAGPQILSAFFIATSPAWKRATAGYLLGAGISISLVLGAGYLLIHGSGEAGEGGGSGLTTTDYVILALLLFALVRTYLGRDESEPPKWMGKLQTVTPKAAFVLGFLLLGFFPSDLVTSVSIGAFLAHHGDPYWQALPFVLFTLLLLAAPALLVLSLGEKSKTVLPKIHDWMDQNAWIVSEIVIVFFIAIILTG
jgi:hypothetical protein